MADISSDLLLLVALGFDLYVGGLTRDSWRHGLTRLLDRVVDWPARKLNRPQRSEPDRRRRGVLALAGVSALAVVVGLAISHVARGAPLLWMLELAALVMLIRVRGPRDRALTLARALAVADRAGAERALAPLTARALIHADDYELARLGIAALARRFAGDVLTPVLAYGLFGLAGLLFERMLDAFVRHCAGPEDAAFGAAARALGRTVAWIPNRLAALLLSVAGWRRGGAVRATWHAVCALPAADAPVAAMANTLGLALGGPRRYAARVVDAPWIGSGRARAEPADLAGAASLYMTAALSVGALVLAVWLAGTL